MEGYEYYVEILSRIGQRPLLSMPSWLVNDDDQQQQPRDKDSTNNDNSIVTNVTTQGSDSIQHAMETGATTLTSRRSLSSYKDMPQSENSSRTRPPHPGVIVARRRARSGDDGTTVLDGEVLSSGLMDSKPSSVSSSDDG